MIPVTYFRSSSYTAWSFCQNKYFIDYTLGFHSKANISAARGSVVHKALELLSRKKLSLQQGEAFFNDPEFGRFNNDDVNPDTMIQLCYEYYVKKEAQFNWKKADFTECKRYMNVVLNYKGGMFSPLKREIVAPEQYFDFLIEEPWAAYDYTLIDGQRITGYLGIKGTMDLMTKVGEDYEMIDWKTGARKDWNIGPYGTEKTYEKLMEDPQLLLYYYAAKRLYPNIKHLFVTIFFTKDGGPFSLCYGEEHIELLKKLLKERLAEISNTVRPKLIYPNKKCGWCEFSKTDLNGPIDDYSKSTCQIIHNDIIQIGIDKVIMKYAKDKSFNNYSEGGGRTHKEIKDGN